MKKGTYGSQNGVDRPPRKQGGMGKGDDAEFRGYINLNLSDEQKAAYDAWAEGGSIWEALEHQVAAGVNISIKRVPKEDGFLASATQRDPGSPNAGLVVTARGKLASVAWGRVLFCLTILSHKEKWEETQPLASADRW